MHDGRFPFEVASGVPVVTAPEEIDITNAPALRSALLKAATHGHGTVAVDMYPGSGAARSASGPAALSPRARS
jgi:hypothetical protein